MRVTHHAAMPMPWERGCPARATAPRARRRPPPGPSPAGGGNPAPPPSGRRPGGGLNAAHDGHLSRSCGCAAQRRNVHTGVPGRAQPSQTLPRVGAWGNPVSPCPSSRAYVPVSHHAGLIKGNAGSLKGRTEPMGSEPPAAMALRAHLSSRSEKRPEASPWNTFIATSWQGDVLLARQHSTALRRRSYHVAVNSLAF